MTFLIIGGGSIGKRHLANLKLLGHNEVMLMKRQYDASVEKELGVKVVTSFKEAKEYGITAVLICTPTALHNQGLQFAIENNCAVFMEKPLVHSQTALEEAQSLINKLTKSFFIGFMLRYHPLVNQLKELIDKKILGEVYSARFSFGSYLPFWHPWEDYKEGYAAREALGGGVINTISHELDLIQYYFGSPDSVMCNKRNVNRLGIEVEEVADAIFNYDDNVVTLHLDYLQKEYQRQIELLCDEGRIYWEWHSNEICIKKYGQAGRKITLDKEFDVNQLYLEEMSEFLELAKKNVTDHPLDQHHAIANMKLILAMHASADLGKRIEC